jgi:hypothetical protein
MAFFFLLSLAAFSLSVADEVVFDFLARAAAAFCRALPHRVHVVARCRPKMERTSGLRRASSASLRNSLGRIIFGVVAEPLVDDDFVLAMSPADDSRDMEIMDSFPSSSTLILLPESARPSSPEAAEDLDSIVSVR